MGASQQALLMRSAGAVGALDAYTTNLWAAYGKDRLIGSYAGSAKRIRKTSGGDTTTEHDVPLGATTEDTADAGTFIGSESAAMVKWYDQFTGAKDIVQSTTTKQPQVAASGSWLGKVRFDGSAFGMQTPALPGGNSGFTIFIRYVVLGAGNQMVLEQSASASSGDNFFLFFDTSQANRYRLLACTNGATTAADGIMASAPLPALTACTGYRMDRTQSTNATALKHITGGAVSAPSQNGPNLTALPVTGNFSTNVINLGARNNAASLWAQIDVQTLVIYTGALSDADCIAINALL